MERDAAFCKSNPFIDLQWGMTLFGSSPPAASGLLRKIVVFVRMALSSARKQRSAPTDLSLVQVLGALPRANRVFIRINTIRIKTRFLNKVESVYSLSRISVLKLVPFPGGGIAAQAARSLY